MSLGRYCSADNKRTHPPRYQLGTARAAGAQGAVRDWERPQLPPSFAGGASVPRGGSGQGCGRGWSGRQGAAESGGCYWVPAADAGMTGAGRGVWGDSPRSAWNEHWEAGAMECEGGLGRAQSDLLDQVGSSNELRRMRVLPGAPCALTS